MAASLVGGAFLSATLQVLFDRLASHEVVDYLRGKKFNHGLLKKLKIMLMSVNAVLNDAEEKQIRNPAVKQWLDELEDAAYDADDLLDEIATDASQFKLQEARSRTSTKKIGNVDPTSLKLYHQDMETKMEEILERLEFIVKQKDFLGLKEGFVEKPSPRIPATSLVKETEVYGRDGDKEAIIKLLLTDDIGSTKVCVIPIVGMAGVGKTTLAQLAYNNDKIKEHFELKAWVCVSEDFDICKVTKAVVFALTKSYVYDNADLESLQTSLKEILMEKKFFLILDDVWNENYVNWEAMSKPFQHGAQGSKILVTTRNESVAQIMHTVPSYYLEHLKDEDCWKLFAKHAFTNADFNANPILETIGRKVVKKCKGLPLAVKTLGGLLHSKMDIGEWERISKSEIWDFSDNESNILPALRLSYHYLSSHLKRCFAFCSIFSKNHEFQKHQLVLLWMATNLLLQSKRNKRMEDVGDEYFNELVSRSFFQRSSSAKQSCYVMHDLVHDLAKYVSKEYCYTLEDGNLEEVAMKVRHLGIAQFVSYERFDSISKATRLCTLLPFSDFSFHCLSNEVVNDVILKLRCLRVLSLYGCRKLKKLTDSIGELRHLRYLNLSSTNIARLPESVSMLYNLQTLNLSYCYNLIELPKDMHHLINLRHLDIRECYNLVEMPGQLSELKNLQTLSTFIVGKDNGNKIGELRELLDLRGELSLKNLQNVASAKYALEAKLVEKKYLEAVHFSWKGDTSDSKHDREILEKLLPHTYLKRLGINGYGGTAFPNWLGNHSFCNILSIKLYNCKYCNCLPPLGQLPCLKSLYIDGLSGVVTVGAEFYRSSGSSVRNPFPSLEFLSFHWMSSWKEWPSSTEVGDCKVFSKLRELEISNCNRLITVNLPHKLPCLTKLKIDGSQVLVSSLQMTPAIRHLELGECEILELQQLPQAMESIKIAGDDGVESLIKALRKSQNCCLQSLYISDCSLPIAFPSGCLPTTLTELEIKNCEKLEFPMHNSLKTLAIQKVHMSNSCGSLKFFPLDFFPNLNNLDIEGCENLESLTVSDSLLCQNLSSVEIKNCHNFISFPEGGLQASNLTQLSVVGCNKLKKLPEKMHNLLTSLQYLGISDCPVMESFPEGGLPSNLAQLRVQNCSKLIANRMQWNLQTLEDLKYFAIRNECGGEGGGVESFPEEGLLPSTLVYLYINGLPSLKTLDIKGLQQLTSLKSLIIQWCPQLQNLPEEGLPNSLAYLSIYNCPSLKERCQRENGKDWNKISHIPRIMID